MQWLQVTKPLWWIRGPACVGPARLCRGERQTSRLTRQDTHGAREFSARAYCSIAVLRVGLLAGPSAFDQERLARQFLPTGLSHKGHEGMQELKECLERCS